MLIRITLRGRKVTLIPVNSGDELEDLPTNGIMLNGDEKCDHTNGLLTISRNELRVSKLTAMQLNSSDFIASIYPFINGHSFQLTIQQKVKRI